MGVALSEIGRAERHRGETSPVPTRAKLDAFCKALSDATGISVKPYAAPRYDRLLRRLRLGEVELAWLPPVLALTALPKDAVPLALPMRGKDAWFWTALFTRADSPIVELTDLSQAHVVWVNRESASGYLVMRAALRAEGIDPDRAFAKQSFAQSHDAMVRTVMDDATAVGSTYLHLDQKGAASRAGWANQEVRVLKRAGPIPSDLLAASKELAEPLRERVAAALTDGTHPALQEAASALFFATHLSRVEASHLSHLEVLGRYLLRERIP